MFNFIQNCPKSKLSEIKIIEVLSDTKIQTEGVPQGNLIYPLFLYSNFTRSWPSYQPITDFKNSSPWTPSRYPTAIKTRRLLRKDCKIYQYIRKFCPKNRFTFSTSITYMIHFTSSACPPSLELWLCNTSYLKCNTVRCLYLVLLSMAKLEDSFVKKNEN